MNQALESEKTWLVKSSGTVLGPYALEEVIQLLTNKKISLIDEIRSPECRWMFIREHKQFANIVQFLREQQTEAKEDTGSTFIGTKTVTMSPMEENTAVPMGNPTHATQNSLPPMREPVEAKPITYAAQNDIRVQRKIETDSKWVTTFAWTALVLLILGGTGYWYMNQSSKPKLTSYAEYIQMAQHQQAIGHLDQALSFYRKAESVQKLQPKHRMAMVPLLMVVEKQNAQARQVLDDVRLEMPPSPELNIEIENLVAFSYLSEGNLPEAKKRLTAVVRNIPPIESALVNLLEILILEGQYAEAVESARNIMRVGVKEPLVYLFRSLASYRLYQENEKLEIVVEELKRYVGRFSDRQVEAYLLMAATQKKMGLEKEVNQTIKAMLQVDPDLTRKHVHDLLVHQDVFQWGYLSAICEILVKGSLDSPPMKALGSYCSYQSGDIKSAIEQVEKARAQYTADVTLLGLQAFLLQKSGRLEEAKALIQATAGTGNELLVSSAAWVCQEQKDWTCAEREWKRIQGLNPQNLASFAGLARAAFAQGKTDRAKDLVQQGLLISDQYRPLLEIKDQINED